MSGHGFRVSQLDLRLKPQKFGVSGYFGECVKAEQKKKGEGEGDGESIASHFG